MILHTTKEMIEEFGEGETNNKIYHFQCNCEKDIETELKNRIVTSDNDRNTMTHYILDENKSHKILAFFTLKFGIIEKKLLGHTVFICDT